MFVVIENTPGYLPEGEPAEFQTWDDAVDYAETLTKQLEQEGYICWRQESIGSHWIAHCEPQEMTPNYQPRLGRVVEIVSETFAGKPL